MIDAAKVHKKSAQNMAFFDFFLIFLKMLKCKIMFFVTILPGKQSQRFSETIYEKVRHFL